MSPPPPGDQARVSVQLAVPPEQAFRCFTEDVNLWWRRGRRFRNAPGERGLVCIEPGEGGRLFESFDTEAGEQVVEIGRTLVWAPPTRLVLRWRASNFGEREHTEVEVRFQAQGSGTLVTLTHRGWSTIRDDHPVRHGLERPAFLRMMGLWWGDQLVALRAHTIGASPAPRRP